MELYEIGVQTLAIVGMPRKKAKIVESDRQFIISDSAYRVMDYNCNYFGSSYAGREEGCRKILGFVRKSPIILEETQDIIFFPTHSPRRVDCIFVALENVSSIVGDEKSSIITFKNGTVLPVPRSKYSVKNQMDRAIKLKYLISERKKRFF